MGCEHHLYFDVLTEFVGAILSPYLFDSLAVKVLILRWMTGIYLF
jgi:hypothetical protein